MADGEYFASLSAALREAGVFQPCLILDRDRLDWNIGQVEKRLSPNLGLRLVDKSLASLPLLRYIADALGERRFMTFHLPVTRAVMQAFPHADLLLGKPMPVEGAGAALADGDPAWDRVCWLIDTEQRLAEYGGLARLLGRTLRVAFEVDVGLHRGGFADVEALRRALARIAECPELRCDGIMAYEAHAPHIPSLFGGPGKALKEAQAALAAFAGCLGPDQRTVVNVGGSKTALLYGAATVANETSIGSAFVLPSDFDTAGLDGFQPAAFIVTPILKVVEPRLPGPPFVTKALQALGRFPSQGCFLYGGKWMAEPVFPEGMAESALFGLSSNQQFMGLPAGTPVRPGDYAFLRPTQSEAVLQQVGSIKVFSAGAIVDEWPALPMA